MFQEDHKIFEQLKALNRKDIYYIILNARNLTAATYEWQNEKHSQEWRRSFRQRMERELLMDFVEEFNKLVNYGNSQEIPYNNIDYKVINAELQQIGEQNKKVGN